MSKLNGSSATSGTSRALVAWLLVLGTVLALLLAHSAERPHADSDAGTRFAVSLSTPSPDLISQQSSSNLVSSGPSTELVGLQDLDAGLLCLTLAIGCVIALLLAALRLPARASLLLTLLPRPGPIGSSSADKFDASSASTAFPAILRV
ncbi:hypothetical protein L3i23_00310 [Herbiconiux sp. L3-i23]|nr:hypothetical protein L3i23_00310 [Herbiconiux sp. L3-i23]